MSTSWEIRFTKQAKKDVDSLTPKLKSKLYDIVTNKLAIDPFEGKRLLGDLYGSYSLRLTYKDRIIYSIDQECKVVFIERAKTHYGD